MNEPHVEKLVYRFASENMHDKFDKAKPLKTTIGKFEVELSDGIVTAIPLEHYSNEEAAKTDFEPLLRSWESSAFISPSRFQIYFRFSHADVIDRNPTPGNTTLYVHSSSHVHTADIVTLTQDQLEYPLPNENFVSSPLTDELIGLIKRYRDGGMTLTAMTSWFLSTLEREYGSRASICKSLIVQEKVISTLGCLGESSDPVHGRKAIGHGPAKFSPEEINWLETIIYRLVIRIGEVNAGIRNLSLIRLVDLPNI